MVQMAYSGELKNARLLKGRSKMREEDKVVIQIIAEIMEVDEADMSPDLTLFDLGADELDMVDITLALEQAMDIEFPDSRLLINPEKDAKFTVGDVISIASEFY